MPSKALSTWPGVLLTFFVKKSRLKTHYHNSAIFSQPVNSIEFLFSVLNVQLKIGMNQSLI